MNKTEFFDGGFNISSDLCHKTAENSKLLTVINTVHVEAVTVQ